MIEVKSTKRDTHYVKLTVYGDAGVGKTVLCSTAPAPIILSAEAGLLSLAQHDIPVIEIYSVKDLREAFTYLTTQPNAYQTICLDSISEIAEQVLDAAITDLTKKAEAEGRNVEPRHAYGKLAIQMMQLTRAFRNIPDKHIVFTAKQGHMHDGNIEKYGPMLPGQAYTQNFPYLVDILCCMRVAKDDTRYLQTQPDMQYIAKDRSGKLEKAEQPNLTDLFDKVTQNGRN